MSDEKSEEKTGWGRFDSDMTADIAPENLPKAEEMTERVIETGRTYHLSNGMVLKQSDGFMYADPLYWDFNDTSEVVDELVHADFHALGAEPSPALYGHGETAEGNAVAFRFSEVVAVEVWHTMRLAENEDEIRSCLHNRLNDERRRKEEKALKEQFNLESPPSDNG